jgi:hypothetical protein
MRTIGYLLFAFSLVGCAHRKQVKTEIPKQCIRPIAITNFTKPCHPISDSLAICDGVEVRYSCIRYVSAVRDIEALEAFADDK